MRYLFAWVVVGGMIAGCGGTTRDDAAVSPPAVSPPAASPPEASPPAASPPAADVRPHDARFVGVWLVEQPTHALYEATQYRFEPDGALVAVASTPGECKAHLARHCVTGSVANCVSPDRCEGTVSCVFGDTWSSDGAATLVITGKCSDGQARPIRIAFRADATSNATGGADAKLVSVGGEPNWSHDNWPWVFRKCAADDTSCLLGN
jgi:hypothetical protein